jgi:hypothetical protein
VKHKWSDTYLSVNMKTWYPYRYKSGMITQKEGEFKVESKCWLIFFIEAELKAG